MAREYSSKRSARKGNSASQQLLLIVVTFLLGYLTASVVDIQTVGHWMNTQILESHDSTQTVVSAESKSKQAPVKPKFEFYTLLANEKVGPAGNNRGSAAATTQTASTTAGASTITANHTVANKVTAATTRPQQVTPVKVVEAKPVAIASARKENFVVQVASFKARNDAEHMKGLLILKGFEVTVVPVVTAQGNWFRVLIGPYPNRMLAQKAQVILAKTERLNGMVKSV